MSFLSKIFWVIFSFLVATSLWYMVRIYDRVETQFDVPIDYLNIPPKLIITKGLERTATVRLRGPSLLVRSLNLNQFTHKINLADLKPGTTPIPMILDNISGMSRAFQIVDVQPPRLLISAEISTERSVPITLVPRSTLRNTVTYKDLKASPEYVTIRGPQSVLAKTTSIITYVNIDTKAHEGFVSTILPLDTPGLITPVPSSVRVSYTVTSGRSIVIRPYKVKIDSPHPEQYLVTPQEVSFALEVPEALENSDSYLNSLDLSIIPPEMQPGAKTTVEVRYIAPEGMTIVPPSVTSVTIERKQETSNQ